MDNHRSSAHEEFVCEAMTPVAGTGDAAAMARGEPGLPGRFVWRGEEYRIIAVIESWKTSGVCHSTSRQRVTEKYLRRHWYKVITDPPAVLTVYCDRQAKDRKHPKARWWVYTIERTETF